MKFPLWRRERRNQELSEEMQAHLTLAEREAMEAGKTAKEASYAARKEFGNVGVAEEVTRDTWGWRWLVELWQDVRYGVRNMLRTPAFTAVTILTLALGIGANTAIFSVVDAVLFRALPYRDAGKLVWATNVLPRQGQNLVFADEYAGWRTQNHVFEGIAGYSTAAEYTLTGVGTPERLKGAQVTESFLNVLGVKPQLGRNFLPEEDLPAGPKTVMLSDAVWRSSFGANPKVVGHIIALDDTPYTVVGVLPRNFEFLDNSPADVLVPFQLADSSIQVSNRQVRVMIQPMSVIARLKPGATVAGALAELNAIDKRVLANLPAHLRGLGEAQAQVFLLHDHEIGNVRPALLVLLGAVGFVLLIACANVANLQLARAATREKEVAIRGALGAGRWRLARQLLTESSAAAVVGGVAGLLLAAWVIRLIHRFAPANIPHLQGARLDLRVLVFTLVVSLLTGILFGLAPVLAAFRVSLNNTLKEGGLHSGSSSGTRRAQRVLMVVEIGLSLVLFVGAGFAGEKFPPVDGGSAGFRSARSVDGANRAAARSISICRLATELLPAARGEITVVARSRVGGSDVFSSIARECDDFLDRNRRPAALGHDLGKRSDGAHQLGDAGIFCCAASAADRGALVGRARWSGRAKLGGGESGFCAEVFREGGSDRETVHGGIGAANRRAEGVHDCRSNRRHEAARAGERGHAGSDRLGAAMAALHDDGRAAHVGGSN